MKSNYDKFPAIKVPTDDGCRAVAGWEAIGAEKLHATIKAYVRT